MDQGWVQDFFLSTFMNPKVGKNVASILGNGVMISGGELFGLFSEVTLMCPGCCN